jgi:hypothetical protein
VNELMSIASTQSGDMTGWSFNVVDVSPSTLRLHQPLVHDPRPLVELQNTTFLPREDQSFSVTTIDVAPPSWSEQTTWSTDDMSETVSTLASRTSSWHLLFRRELKIARHILNRASTMDVTAPLDAYVSALIQACNEDALEAPAPATARLIYLRTSLLERVAYPQWLQLRAAISPRQTEFRVPSRFLAQDSGGLYAEFDSAYFDEVVAQSLDSFAR